MRFLLFTFVFFFTAIALSLSSDCPKGLKKKNGLCYYDSPYLTESSARGLKKGITVFQNGFHPKQIDLGRILFFDPILSKDGSLSCAHCHQPELGLTDGKKRSLGKNNNELTRGAPSLWNVAFLESYFWDGRANTLEEQLAGPLFSENEMGNTPEHLEKTLNALPTYRALFLEAFGSKKISYPLVAKALTTFERTLVSFNSRYDQFVFGKHDVLTLEEINGHNVFRSFVARCTECHTPPLFTNSQMANLGLPDSGIQDNGLENITGDIKHKDHFRVPTLRNISSTAPYMHAGIFTTLAEVIHFYNTGGGRDGIGKKSPYIHWHIRKMGLSTEEENQIVAFLKTLNDDSAKPEVPDRLPSGLNTFKGEKLK